MTLSFGSRVGVSQLRIYRTPTPLRSGHLNIKDAECAESNKKLYFRFLVFELLVVKELPIRLQKNNFFQKWPNLQGQLGLNWQWFFARIIFYVRFLVFEMWSILYFHLCNAFGTRQKFEEKKLNLVLRTLAWLVSVWIWLAKFSCRFLGAR